MDTNLSELPYLSNIGLMLTYKCTIACPHCIVEAGPHKKEEMRREHALAWIEQANTYRKGHIKGIALTGGEPFCNLENLAQVSTYAKSFGFIISAVTNAFWASTQDGALSVLSKLPAIQMISISTDIYHQKSIPFDYVKNAVWAAKELGLLYNIAVCMDNKENQKYQQIMEELKEIGETDRIRVSTVFPVGRAYKNASHFNYHTVSKPTIAACSTASSPVIFPDGKVMACIGPVLTLPPTHSMFLGNLHQETLSEILDRSELNPVLHTLRIWGPHKLVSLLRQNGLETLLPKEYICDCICDVCYKLLSDDRIVDALKNIMQDQQILETIAYARLYYLKETKMAELFHLEN
jgi:MoaA/NifB/PqqE/SkfB family radical SAM enzyme